MSRRTGGTAGRSSARGERHRSSTCGFFPSIALAQAVSTAAVLVTGGVLYWDGRVTIGTVAAVALYLNSLFEPVGRLGDWYSELQTGRAALTKIVDLLETPVTVHRRTRELPPTGDLAVEAAHFSYDSGPPAVDGVVADDPAGRAPRARRVRPAPASRRSRSCSRDSTTR